MASLSPQTSALAAFNAAPADAAERDVLACCASTAFAKAITSGRPYQELASLTAAAAAEFDALSWDDIVESMNAHPRIGDRAADSGRPAPDQASPHQAGTDQAGPDQASIEQASIEQAGAATASDDVRRALAAGNLAYEKRFGHIFLICASGLSGQEMLDQLTARLNNDHDAERTVVRTELLKITQLRLAKLLTG
jgi:2-oxo-4-hydroxy-4-carboxy-5-ureidoimidazoline decarboxylase